ncbi:thermonuclease family protein [Brevundimonas vitis]|uniref:Thermonuclease family protein n=1 Tax=Brevundimonas vitisensis TaxID=2800818 RepID=A0ABX7BST6_9CAUL|nr:thermonuclease family protein [Brevundimonas vitisensis]
MIVLPLICATLLMSDGDSGRCITADGEQHRIRLQGIDAGEVSPFTRCRQQPGIWACSDVARRWAPAARERARALAADGASCTEVDRDRYGRIVAVCTVGGRDMGETLVREGLAISDPIHRNTYGDEQRDAQRASRGVWR